VNDIAMEYNAALMGTDVDTARAHMTQMRVGGGRLGR
jgi:hypothetical protein